MKSQSWGDSAIKQNVIFNSVNEAPKFPGGLKAFFQFIADNILKPENDYARFSNKLVMVKIVIDKQGKVVFAEIEKGINNNYNQVVIELIKKMPFWEPGKQNKKPVYCYLTIPIVFID